MVVVVFSFIYSGMNYFVPGLKYNYLIINKNMIQDCKFNKLTDLQEHVPSLATDINKAIETNTVQDTGVVADYNDITDPSFIRGRVGDVFDAIDAQKEVLSRGKIVSPASPVDPVSVSNVSSDIDKNS